VFIHLYCFNEGKSIKRIKTNMPQKIATKSKTQKKSTTAPRKTASKTTHKKSSAKQSLRSKIKGFINKKTLLVGAGVIVLIGLGGGGVALWQNMNAGAAGGWTKIGGNYLNGSGSNKIIYDIYACQVTVPKAGSSTKGRIVITSVKGNWPGWKIRASVAGTTGTTVGVSTGATATASSTKIYKTGAYSSVAVQFSNGVTQDRSFVASSVAKC
jgi:hypothetical protein